MKRIDFLGHLFRIRACGSAIDWCHDTPEEPQALWDLCNRGDWLLWLAARAGVRREDIVLAACDCARTASEFVGDEKPPLLAVQAAERWARGEGSITSVRTAVDAAYFDYDEQAGTDAGAAHAYAAATVYTADSTYPFVAAAAASHTAYAMRGDTDSNVRHNVYTKSLRVSADLVRKRIQWPAVEAALQYEGCEHEHR